MLIEQLFQSLVLLTTGTIQIFDVETLQRTDEVSLYEQSISLARSISPAQALKTYKGKVFLFVSHYKDRAAHMWMNITTQTASDVRAGVLLAWADRVLQLVDTGDLVSAIELTVAYYNGQAVSHDNRDFFNANLGLPSQDAARKIAVGPKLGEILFASMEYVFSEDRMRDSTHDSSDGKGRGVDRTTLFETFVDATIRASLAIDNFDFLFEDLYEKYSAEGIASIFLDRLEPFVLDGSIQSIPTTMVQQLLKRHEERDELQEAENLIWHLRPECLDVNQAVELCSSHRLYDALIYLYTQALADFVGPLVELLDLVRRICKERRTRPRNAGIEDDDSRNESPYKHLESTEALFPYAYKTYSYLADALIGISHPGKERLPDETARTAKIALYTFLFSENLKAYPQATGNLVQAAYSESVQELRYPYLRLLLDFDSEAMLDCLDIAFEDSYLDEEASGHTPDRQQIIDILFNICYSAAPNNITTLDRTFINIFVARNLPKYSQFVQIPSAALQQILRALASDSDLSTQDDRQLAVEYLLSAYSPTYDEPLLQLFAHAGFFRVLASIYRSKKAWRNLASVYIRDPDQNTSIFQSLSALLSDARRTKEGSGVQDEIIGAVFQLVECDVDETAALFDRFMSDKHALVLRQMESTPLRQMAYLRSLLEPSVQSTGEMLVRPTPKLASAERLLYVSLLCDYDSDNLIRYLAKDTQIDKQSVMQICREKQVYEIVIWSQAQFGKIQESLLTMAEVLDSRSDLITVSLLQSDPKLSRYIGQIVKASKMAIDICTGKVREINAQDESDMWNTLLSSLVEFVRKINMITAESHEASLQLKPLQALLPEALSALISSTTSRSISLNRLVRRLMSTTSPGAIYAEYRTIVESMLAAYHFEEDLLCTSNRLVKVDLYEHVAEVSSAKAMGWRPNMLGHCEACGERIWVEAKAYESINLPDLTPESVSVSPVMEKLTARPGVSRRPSLKGKETDWYEEPVEQTNSAQSRSVVVFRGGAACHATCLEQNGHA